MKLQFAIVDGVRKLPAKGNVGQCPNCGEAVIAKCGNQRIHHWAHKSTRACDAWWENETQWHIDWKNRFPSDWHEISQTDQSGERHIADIKRPDGFVVEFQHSHISDEERRKREEFYGTMVWIVDGTRLKRSVSEFQEVLTNARLVIKTPPTFQVAIDESSLIKKWITSDKVVYFDFGDVEIASDKVGYDNNSIVWRLDPSSTDYQAFLTPLFKTRLVSDIQSTGMMQPSTSGIFQRLPQHKRQLFNTVRPTMPPQPLRGFERYLAAKQRRRSRIRL